MEEICRLCCSSNFVRNDIFDEETALHLKMSLYMPIKVFRGDQLPQKICDRCSCRVNDLYQFCNEAIEVQNKLRAALLSTGHIVEQCVDLTMVKDCHSPPPLLSPIRCEQSTQTDLPIEESNSPNKMVVKIKEEPREPTPPPQIKPEHNLYDDKFHVDYDNFVPDMPSDSSEDLTLINLRRKKKKKKYRETQNGEVVKRKRGRPKLTENGEVGKHKTGKRGRPRKEKPSMGELEMLISVLPEGTTIGVVDKPVKTEVKEEDEDSDGFTYDDITVLKQELVEPDRYYCCICFKKYKYSRSEMMKHYRDHAYDDDLPEVLPEPPPVPQEDPCRCPRCVKMVASSQWKEHWRRHFVRDRRPYRCALCEKAFRDPVQIIKHGQSHAEGPKKEESSSSQTKRFVCDLCPEAFVYMKYLLAHRSRDHPEAATVPLNLRCGECSRTFAHINSLRRHMRSHTGERNFLCNICGKSLSSREHLKFHIRIHTGYKPHECKVCGKGFTKKCNLTLHERVHTGEKPYVCQHCNKGFSQRSTLTIHLRYHSGARPYVCSLCNRGFVARGLLSMHLKTTCI